MAIISDNQKGNKYHDEDGKFTSQNGEGTSDEIVTEEFDLSELELGEDEEDLILDSLEADDDEEDFNLDDDFEQRKNDADIDINDLNDIEIKKSLLFNDELDKEKIDSLSAQEAKELLIAQYIINGKTNEYDKIEYDKTQFEGLWLNPVNATDYLGKKDHLDAKLNYFLIDYQGDDKENKINLLNKFKEVGEDYLAKKELIDEKYNKYKELYEKYIDPNNNYSQKRKDEAIWVKSSSIKKSKELFSGKLFEVLKNFTSEEHDDIVLYTDNFSSINNPLRKMKYGGSTDWESSQFVSRVKNMTSAIDKSTYDKDIWVQRGTTKLKFEDFGISEISEMSTEELNQLVGKTYKDQGFVSCGAAKDTGFSSNNIILNIYCPKGTKMLYVDPISEYPGENEMIIQRGYSYKIKKVEKSGSKIYLDVDTILDSDAGKYSDDKLYSLAESSYNY